MKCALPILILALSLPVGLPALADTGHMDHGHAAGPMAMDAMLAEGSVRKVDKAQGKLTIRHGPLANLDMPAMTMVFRVQNPDMLDGVKAGDSIHFRAERMNGALTVTQIQLSPPR